MQLNTVRCDCCKMIVLIKCAGLWHWQHIRFFFKDDCKHFKRNFNFVKSLTLVLLQRTERASERERTPREHMLMLLFPAVFPRLSQGICKFYRVPTVHFNLSFLLPKFTVFPLCQRQKISAVALWPCSQSSAAAIILYDNLTTAEYQSCSSQQLPSP